MITQKTVGSSNSSSSSNVTNRPQVFAIRTCFLSKLTCKKNFWQLCAKFRQMVQFLSPTFLYRVTKVAAAANVYCNFLLDNLVDWPSQETQMHSNYLKCRMVPFVLMLPLLLGGLASFKCVYSDMFPPLYYFHPLSSASLFFFRHYLSHCLLSALHPHASFLTKP